MWTVPAKRNRRRRWRPRARRLVILGAIVAVTGALVASAYLLRRSHLDAQALEARTRGLDAYVAGDLTAAREGLGRYLERLGDDLDAAPSWHLYGKALLEEATTGSERARALGAQRRALALAPDHLEARRELVGLHALQGHLSEALDHAERILAAAPEDVATRRRQVGLLARANRTDDALVASRELHRQAPTNLEDHFRTLALMQAEGVPDERLLEWARERRQAHAEEPGLALIETAALGLAGRSAALDDALDHAMTLDGLDAIATRILVRQLEHAGRYAHGLEVLQRVRAADLPAPLQVELARRLWYRRLPHELEERLGALVDGGGCEDPEVLGWVALARLAAGRADASRTLVARLRSLPGPVADGWTVFVERVAMAPAASATERREACLEALARIGDQPLFVAALGDAHLAAGEPDLAVASWTRAAELAPGWAVPLARAGRALLDGGRCVAAADLARRAAIRDPASVEALAVWAAARAERLEELDRAEVAELEAAVADVQRRARHEPLTLVVSIRLQARSDPASAAERIRALLEWERSLAESTYLSLAELSAEFRLGCDRECLTTATEMLGPRPRVAAALALCGPRSAAFEDFRRAAARAVGDPQGEWALAGAELLERLEAPEARRAWEDYVDGQPANLRAQVRALRSPVVWSDLAMVDRLIERLGRLGGEDGVAWQLARARWLLATSADAPMAAEAASLLREVVERAPGAVEAHLVLAQALHRLGEGDEARDVAVRAFSRFPDDERAAHAAAALFAADGEWQSALSMARAWQSRRRSLDPAADALAAHALVALARPDEAIEALRPHVDAAVARPAGREHLLVTFVTAALRAGRIEDATVVARRLALADPVWRGRWLGVDVRALTADVAMAWLGTQEELLLAAESTQEPPTARECVALARAWRDQLVLGADPDCRERVGRWTARASTRTPVSADELFECGALLHEAGDAAAARTAYRRAIEHDPSLAAAHNNLAMLDLAAGSVGGAIAAAERACQLDREEPEYLDSLGSALRAAGRFDRAATCYRRASDLDGADARFRIALGEVLLEGGRADEAARAIEAWALRPTDRDALPPPLRRRYDVLLTRLSHQARVR